VHGGPDKAVCVYPLSHYELWARELRREVGSAGWFGENFTVSGEDSAVTGDARPVAIPANSDTPFGLVTRGANAYVTIAHSDEVALVKQDQIRAVVRPERRAAAGSMRPAGWRFSVRISTRPTRRATDFAARRERHADPDRRAGGGLDDRRADRHRSGGPVRSRRRRVGRQLTRDAVRGCEGGELTQMAQATVPAAINGIGIVVD
jgi:MOSC domain-containing protein